MAAIAAWATRDSPIGGLMFTYVDRVVVQEAGYFSNLCTQLTCTVFALVVLALVVHVLALGTVGVSA